MTPASWWLLAIVALVVVILLEGRRQRRRYGRPRGTGTLMARAGLLELQRQLEPERKVELLVEERREPERDAQGEPPRAGGETGHGAPRSTE